jgi:hypothetical protein
MTTLLHTPQHVCLNLLSRKSHTYEVSISCTNLTLILHNSTFLIRPFSYGPLVRPCGVLDGPASKENMLSPSLRSKWVTWICSWDIWSRGKQSGPLDPSNLPRYLNNILTQVSRSHPETRRKIFFRKLVSTHKGGWCCPCPQNRGV